MSADDDIKRRGLDQLEVVARGVRRNQALVDEVIRDLRQSKHATWAEIGAALGVSRQAAWRKYRGVDDADQLQADRPAQ